MGLESSVVLKLLLLLHVLKIIGGDLRRLGTREKKGRYFQN